MEGLRNIIETMAEIERIRDFVYNDPQIKKVLDMCEFMKTFLDKHGSFEKVIELLSIIDNQSYILKDDYTAEEAATYLGLSKRQVYRLAENHEFPYSRPGGKMIYVKRKDIVKWISKNRIMSEEEMDEMVAEKLKELNEKKVRKKH